MAQSKGTKASDPLKIAGGVLLLAGSIALMIHRMPKRGYVEVHADKPRPTADAAPSVAAAAPTAAQPVSAAASHSPSTPASRAPEPVPLHAAAHEAALAAIPKAAPARVVDADELSDDCRPEIAILCYKIPTKGLARCLREYDDALMTPCRRALKSFGSPRRPIDEDETGD